MNMLDDFGYNIGQAAVSTEDGPSRFVDYREWTPETTVVITYDIGLPVFVEDALNPDKEPRHMTEEEAQTFSKLHRRRWALSAEAARDHIEADRGKVYEEQSVPGRMFFRVARRTGAEVCNESVAQ